MKTYDVIIAGLGTAGAATCMELARRNVSVLGLDALRPPHNMGSHHGKSRSIRRAYLEGRAYIPMACHAWSLWRKLEQDAGVRYPIHLLLQTGREERKRVFGENFFRVYVQGFREHGLTPADVYDPALLSLMARWLQPPPSS